MGSVDNALFTINGDLLETAAVFNYSVKRSYSIRIRSTDQGGLYTEKAKTISVTWVNGSAVAMVMADAAALPSETTGTIPLSLSRVDLLAAVMDEMGDFLGQQDSGSGDPTYQMLPLGVRSTLAADRAIAALYER